ncbi:Predicted oxidoreductase, contains short-chain dehydrogenase (SDR) and DUF2520 domains [Catalinimonas alkaloidigena]|uniref:Predicted oxidoreductase, contains short-chain dehydrogenase (SDR) and DUF2520 domains n=1 Tax=Catalinimonas alkaloidigena TaxID=1075417 RepID=A0A1G9MZ41_9BACT|nr:Rossmann-like and DUF2520 domain-containing protein [Catalinimonas alkaloidigena]SDL79394.1 Predicted oxidoreductase, contains short-chain dehydrogenase (SDR) and DUF2520 domains [Catalinimonas alkaloidigena]
MKPSVAFIGAGRVAWHLAPALDRAGYAVQEVWSRYESSRRFLCYRLAQASTSQPTPHASLDFSTSTARLLVIAVTDEALPQVAATLVPPPEALVVHTSGSTPLAVLDRFPKRGVLYPLQTFSKEQEVDFRNVPLLVEGHNEATASFLSQLAHELGGPVHHADSTQRLTLHLAAVLTNNFPNYLYTLAQQLLKNAHLDVGLLAPLWQETFQKAAALGPQEAQTGPARRGDRRIIDLHQQLLTAQPDLLTLYRLLSESILHHYHV